MKLTQVRIDKFRNIVDSSPIDMEKDITCLVGKNESGKTALLHALYRLLPSRLNATFSIADHYPAWLEKQHRLRGLKLEEEKPVSATFELGEKDKEKIKEKYGIYLLSNDRITLSRNYAGTLFYTIDVEEKKFVQNIIKRRTIPDYLKKEVMKNEDIKSLLENLETLQGRTNVKDEVKNDFSTMKIDIETYLGEGVTNLSESVWQMLQPRVPEFFYFHIYSTLPYSVDIEKILKKDENALTDEEITARTLLRLAAADNDYLLNPDYERRKRELENVANSLTQDVLKYWSQNPNLRVHPDITQKTVDVQEGKKAVLDELKIRIWDDRHLLSLPFHEHSTGFQWFFSFLAAFSAFEFRETPVIILLDEPALGLHARAQSDFLRFIEERLAPKHQVIYTTHSPFMIQPDSLQRVRIVEDRGIENGATVTSNVLTTDADTLFPLQGALGYDLVQHLLIHEHNLVVEGTSDFTYLIVLSDYLKEKKRIFLSESWSIVPAGGIDLIPTFVALLGHHLDVTVLIDAQKAGHQKLSNLASKDTFWRKK